MSDQNGGSSADPAKQFPFYPPEYWMITEQWTETKEESKVDPNSLGRSLSRTLTGTRAIACHPLAHHIAGRATGLQGYVILNSVPITKKLYDWWCLVNTPRSIAADINDRIEGQKDAETKLS